MRPQRSHAGRAWPLGLGALLSACADDAPLVDVAVERGVDVVQDAGFRDDYLFPQTLPGGVALLDLESDGDLDLYVLDAGPVPGALTHGSDPDAGINRLYENDGAGRYVERTAQSGAAAHAGYALGVCAGDVDGDALTDLFVTNLGPDALLVQSSPGLFVERAAGTPLADERFTSACGFADLDRDGHLDLYVTGYVRWSMALDVACNSDGVRDYCPVNMFEGLPDRVWRGDGAGGFEERTEAWGLESAGRGLGLALVDLDQDGDVDVYVANDSVDNALMLNQGDGRLLDASDVSGAARDSDGRPQAGMGVAVGDVDRDGRADLFVTNFAGEPNALYLNRGDGRFRDQTLAARIALHSRVDLGFGCAFADFDRDGLEDLIVGNGHVLRHVGELRPGWSFEQADRALRALPDGGFESWELGEVLSAPHVTPGQAVGDLDGDGDQDVVLGAHAGAVRIADNRAALPGSGWLRVRLESHRGTNRLAIGARVELELDDGTKLVRWVRSGTSFFSQGDLAPHFGVPSGRSAVRLRVRWPDGEELEQPAPELHRTLHLVQPAR